MGDTVLELAIADGIAEITFNKPAKLNAIDAELAERLVAALDTIAREQSVKAIVLKGAGRAFMAGGDLKTFHEAGERAPDAVKQLITPFHEAVRRIRQSRAPVIASVHGAVAGGGLALALACDFVLASDDTIFTPAYLKLATNPDGGTTWSVVRFLGERRALEWLMLGEPMSAQQAASLGLINRVVPHDMLAQETKNCAAQIASGPAEAQASLKRLIWQAGKNPFEVQLEAEARGFISLAGTADFREGVAAFFERRKPRFSP
jgi:2-(1,2-epoxy-1,2-dihydrophenyl)acetyl-CoA isomerase